MSGGIPGPLSAIETVTPSAEPWVTTVSTPPPLASIIACSPFLMTLKNTCWIWSGSTQT
jgi:hypothetical protein